MFPLYFFLLVLPTVSSVYFQITLFEPDPSNILCLGDAMVTLGAIEMNRVHYLNRVGQAFYAKGVPLWDPDTGKLTDFSTHFSFLIDTQGMNTYGHGLAFFLAPLSDSFANPEWDPSVEHVGLNNNAIYSAVYTPWNASLHSGDTADVWIIYNSSTKNLSVSWKYQTTSNAQENTSLFYEIDLMKVLPQWVKVGFSATTGSYVERHTLQSWEFSSSLDIKETNGKNAKTKRFVVGLAVSGGVLIVGAIFAFVVLLIWKGKKKVVVETVNLASINDELEGRVGGPRRFSYRDLVSATNHFSNEKK
nr:l-type lectin-domain containing receptor kinase ix.1 [Quercus suber]